MKYLLITLLIYSITTLSFAAPIAVNSHSCEKVKNLKTPFILVLYKGENISKAMSNCVNDANLFSASFIGLGALQNPTINFFNFSTKQYQPKTFNGFFELLSLNGDITEGENKKRIIHMHASLGDEHYQVIGGHLTDGIVSATAEITIYPFKEKLLRKLDKKVGAAFIVTN